MNILLNYKRLLICVAAVLLAFIISCKKEGTGGKSSINGYVKHHAQPIPNATVYIKYGAIEFPGTSTASYDASVIADANAHYEIKDLRKGDYYLYSVGYDNTITQEVRGGIAVKLKYNKATIIDIPVTE